MLFFKNKSSGFFSSDRTLLGIILFLVGLCGCLAIYNSNFYDDSSTIFLFRQSLWLILGIITYFITSYIPFDYYKKYLVLINILFWLPLTLVLIIGIQVKGMSGWFILFEGYFPIYIQPAELSKPIFLLTLSIVCCLKFSNTAKKLIALIAIYVVWVTPVLLEPDFGTTLIYSVGFFTVIWLGISKKRYLFGLLGIITAIVLYIAFHKPYIVNRIIAFLNPNQHRTGSGWHILQFKYAMAKGGLTGSGIGNAIWSSSYIPLPHTDSIFSSLIESLGFLGVIPIIAGILIIFYFTYTLVFQYGKNNLTAITAITIISVILFQALLHISVNIGLMPTTGITFPLISYGGSSLVSTMLSFGILMSLAAQKEK